MGELIDQVDKKRLPEHIAIIMDGNGRWAKKRGLLRSIGHERGVAAVREIVETSAEIGLKNLTLYTFSLENWKRPKTEIKALMTLLVKTINREAKNLMKNNIRLTTIGKLEVLPERIIQELNNTIEKTKDNHRTNLCLALSYGSRWEIVNAAKEIGKNVAQGKINPDDINENLFTSYLQTNKMPDPELLIRTSGENRISNFLLFQLAYTELYFTPTLWPDFNKNELFKAIIDFQKRERRFGKTSDQV